jgi:hypothetical protein
VIEWETTPVHYTGFVWLISRSLSAADAPTLYLQRIEELASKEIQGFCGALVDRYQQSAAGAPALYLQRIEELASEEIQGFYGALVDRYQQSATDFTAL